MRYAKWVDDEKFMYPNVHLSRGDRLGGVSIVLMTGIHFFRLEAAENSKAHSAVNVKS